MNPQYYNWFFHTTRFAEEFYRWGHGIVDDLWTTRYEDMKRIMIPVPPLEEQELIASYLDKKCAAIDEAIARRRQIIERLEDYRLSQISFMATKGIKNNVQMKNSGTDWFGEIPNTWSVKRFKYIAQVKSNLVEPEPYLSLDQIGPDIIEKNSGRLIGKRTVEDAGVISGNHLFHKGQILYSKVRPALNKVVVAPFDGLCSADMYPIETSMDTEYLKYLMLSKPFVEQTRIIAMIRVKMPKINQDELGDILCVVPPADEQKEIASKINAMCSRVESMIAKNDEIINKLEEYRKSIIYNAVTGKIDCREAV
jgi:type I restriction enzyme S subunit